MLAGDKAQSLICHASNPYLVTLTLNIQDAYDGGNEELKTNKYHNLLEVSNFLMITVSLCERAFLFTFMLSLHQFLLFAST